MTIENEKLRKDDRIIILKPREDVKSVTGAIDTRIFKGENNLHAIMDPRSRLWYFKYEKGAVPGALQQKFTTFARAFDFVKAYMNRRNIDVVEVID